MRRRIKISIEPKFIFIILSLLCLVLVFISFKYNEEILPIKTAVGNVLTPMQKGINSVGGWISSKGEAFTSMATLLEENKSLKEELDIILNENKILQQDKYELESLRDLYELDQKYTSYPKVAARVISSDTNNWYSVFLIDKGSDDGLALNMNVLAGNGLVGIIVEVGHNYSKVRSIIDDSSNVSGIFLKTADSCIVRGNLELIDKGVIHVELIDKNARIKDGYEVITSNIRNKYLPGILIGYISNLKMDSSSLTMSGYLTPAVDFKRLENVLVITELTKDLY